MKVKELIQTLQQFCDPEARIDLADGSSVSNLCYHSGIKVLSIGCEDDFLPEENLAPGWTYLFTDN